MSFEDEDEELNCTLWVGNLDPKITESILFELFVQSGPIVKVHIPKAKDGTGHKGYSFITFQHEESVPFTMQQMVGTSLYGKVLKLQPRPGSKHKKLMDAARESEHQQRQILQQMPVPGSQPQQMQGQPQWFITPQHPQMAHQYQNMLVYPSQMFQTYGGPGLPNLNNGMPAVIQLPPGMNPQLFTLPVTPSPQQVQGAPLQLQQQQPLPPPPEHHHQQYQRGPRPSGDFRHPRPPRAMANGYSTHRHPNGNNAQFASQYSQPQVLNGSQSQSPRYSQPGSRGPRPHVPRPPNHHQTAPPPRNSNKLNGNAIRPPYSHRSPGPSFPTSPPIYATQVYHQSPPPAVGGAPIQYQTDRHFYQQRPQLPPFPTGNIYQY